MKSFRKNVGGSGYMCMDCACDGFHNPVTYKMTHSGVSLKHLDRVFLLEILKIIILGLI